MTNKTLKFYLIHIIVLIISIACLLMNGPMRGGLPIDNTLVERMTFIGQNQLLWSVSWGVWMASALGLFIFCTMLADELPSSFMRTTGLAFVGLGIAPDLIAEVIYAFILPQVVVQHLGESNFAFLEILAAHLTGFLGNGLYNLGGIILTLLLVKQGVIKGWISTWGISAWILGLLLSASIAIGSMQLAEIFTASSMVLSTVWMLIFAYKVIR